MNTRRFDGVTRIYWHGESRRKSNKSVWAVLALLALVLPQVSAAGGAMASQAETPAPDRAGRPNIVLIVLDDLEARAVERMPNVVRLLRNQGTSFANFFVTTPLCCPSRASILRGQYAHNHGVLRNLGHQGGGFPAFHRLGREGSTVASWLQDRGYRTALVGKYLNSYPEGVDPTYVPPGWDEWYGQISGHYFNFQLNENGQVVAYGDRPEDYSTDVYTAKGTDFVRRAAADQQPFFLYLAPARPTGRTFPRRGTPTPLPAPWCHGCPHSMRAMWRTNRPGSGPGPS